MVGVGAADEAYAGAEPLAGEQEGEVVGLGATGGDEGVREARLGGEGAGDERFQFRGRRGLVPGVQGGVEDGGGQVGGGRDSERRAVQMRRAQGVCRVGGALGEDPDQGVRGGRVAPLRQDLADRRAHPGGHRGGAARGQRAAPDAGTGVQRVEDVGEQRA